MTDCVFCRIVARTSHADVEYEDDAVLAFKDIYPKAPIHLLIVPKRHISSIMAMEPADAEVLHSAQDFTPFAGMRVRGWPTHTLLRGRTVFRDGSVLGEPQGQYVKRPIGLYGTAS